MLLKPNQSICGKNDKRIVSKDIKTKTRHISINEKLYNVRQYQLDGVIIKNEKTCDYLILNDDTKKAFFIELKGRNITEAIPQFEGAIAKLKSEIYDYSLFFRIIASKSKTHEIRDSKVLKFKKKYKELVIKNIELIESIE